MAADHIIKSYDEELGRLNKMIVEMGGLAESQLAAAIDAVAKRDSALAARVVEGDAQVDELERELDNLAIRLLAGIVTGRFVLGDRDTARLWFLIPFRDLWGFGVWMAGLGGSTVEWRGIRLRLNRDGKIRPE